MSSSITTCSISPNIASPGEGSANPTDIPDSGVQAAEAAQGSGGPFQGNGLESPNKASKKTSSQKIGNLIFGKSESRE